MFGSGSLTMRQGAVVILIILVIVLSSCEIPTSTSSPVSVKLVVNPDVRQVSTGQTVVLTVEASGPPPLRLKWSALMGELSAVDTPAVIYTAPASTGVDIVTVEVSSSGNTTSKSVSFDITTDDPCATAEITSPQGTHTQADAKSFLVPNMVKISWDPPDCVMIVQYYQKGALGDTYKPVKSGEEINIGASGSGETEIKIWREGFEILSDNTWVWVE